MKKLICIALISIISVGTLAACGTDGSSNNSKSVADTTVASSQKETEKSKETQTDNSTEPQTTKKASNEKSKNTNTKSTVDAEVEKENQAIEDMIDAYQPPAKVYSVDTKKDDPSNSDVKFEYDEKGRISKCFYDANNLNVYQGYTYYDSDNVVEIYVFNDSVVIADVVFDYKAYDKNAGFVEHEGYYFKNIKF